MFSKLRINLEFNYHEGLEVIINVGLEVIINVVDQNINNIKYVISLETTIYNGGIQHIS